MFLISTVHATVMFTLMVPGALLVIGINPKEQYDYYQKLMQEEMLIVAKQEIKLDGERDQLTRPVKEVNQVLTQQDGGEKYDLEELKMTDEAFFNFAQKLGFSEQTLLKIEQDLRD